MYYIMKDEEILFEHWLEQQYFDELKDIYSFANRAGYSQQVLRDNPLLFLHIIRLLDKAIL